MRSLRFPTLRKSAPSLSLLATEPSRAFLEYLFSHLPGVPLAHGDGHPVIVYPGLGAGAWSTGRLRKELTAAGFTAIDWGFGQNNGPRGSIGDWLDQLTAAVRAVHDEHGRKVSLVGWSLGGIYAREVARAAPALVRQVISLGSPFAAKPEATNAAWLYRLLNGAKALEPADLRQLKQGLPVPSTSIYSKSDGVVPWRGCLQARNATSENIEVAGVSHLGMGTSRKVLTIVAERLAQDEGAWRPYRG